MKVRCVQLDNPPALVLGRAQHTFVFRLSHRGEMTVSSQTRHV